MYQREFDQKLNQALPKAVLLYGDNDYPVSYTHLRAHETT